MNDVFMLAGPHLATVSGSSKDSDFFAITPEVLLFIGGALLSLGLLIFFLVFMIMKLREEKS